MYACFKTRCRRCGGRLLSKDSPTTFKSSYELECEQCGLVHQTLFELKKEREE